MHVTSHVESDAYQGLLREKGGSGFPYLVVMDVDGAVLEDEVGRSLNGLRKAIDVSQAFLDLRQRAGAADASMSVRVDYFLESLRRGGVDLTVAKAQMKTLELAPEQRKAADRALTELEFKKIEAAIKGKKDYPIAGAKFAAMKAAGRIPSGRSARPFWLLISFHAEAKKDLALFEDCVKALKPLLRGKKRSLEKLDKRLARLRVQVKGG